MAENEKPRRPWTQRIALFFAVMGPGIITANVDNDAGGLATYSQAGAIFGMDTLWIFGPMCVVLIMVQEMCNRMGVVTGQGLSSLIRERFGVKITFYLMLALLVTNFGNIMAEFAGIAAAGLLFGVPPWIAVPLCAAAVWFLVIRYNYRSVEKVFLTACLFYVAYLITAYLVHPPVDQITHAFVTPKWVPGRAYLVMIIGLFGTTIAPWMQFYQQAAIVEKNVHIDDYAYSKADTVIGGIVVHVVAAAIIIVCAQTLHRQGIVVEDGAGAAVALEPLAGPWARHLFAFGLWNASMFAACILPLSTAYTICEALGWERGVDYSFGDAKQFYVLYTASIALGAAIVLIPKISLMNIMLYSQVVNGVLLPVVLVFMLILASDRELMGEHANSRVYNVASWLTAMALTALSLYYVADLIRNA